MTYLWKDLQVGDVVTIAAWPEELKRELLHEDTIRVYETLIAQQIPLKIHRIDHLGLPYGEFTEFPDGVETWQSLALNHGEIHRIRSADL